MCNCCWSVRGEWQRASMLLVVHDVAELSLAVDVMEGWVSQQGQVLLLPKAVIQWPERGSESWHCGALRR